MNNQIKEFLYMRNLAELKALSKYSLENPLTDIQFKRLMELKKVCLEWITNNYLIVFGIRRF